MTQLCTHLQGRRPVETFSRSRVPPMGDGLQLALGVARQGPPLGQILPQQALSVFVGAALPGTMRIRKEHSDGQSLRQALVLSHLFASIIGQRIAQRGGRYMLELSGKSLSSTPRIRAIKAGQDDQARCPLHETAPTRRAIVDPFDEVA
jgi:hypothetical protein